MPTKQWLQVEVDNEIVIHLLLSFISNLNTSQIYFKVHKTMAASRGWQWDRNTFTVIFHFQPRFQAAVRAYWSKFGKCITIYCLQLCFNMVILIRVVCCRLIGTKISPKTSSILSHKVSSQQRWVDECTLSFKCLYEIKRSKCWGSERKE